MNTTAKLNAATHVEYRINLWFLSRAAPSLIRKRVLSERPSRNLQGLRSPYQRNLAKCPRKLTNDRVGDGEGDEGGDRPEWIRNSSRSRDLYKGGKVAEELHGGRWTEVFS